MRAPDLASVVPFGVEDLDFAIRTLLPWKEPALLAFNDFDVKIAEPITKYGAGWRERAAWHLERRLDRELRERPRLDSEQAALAMIKGVGLELRTAGQALEQAAKRMKDKGDAFGASQTKQAAGRALQAAEGLIG